MTCLTRERVEPPRAVESLLFRHHDERKVVLGMDSFSKATIFSHKSIETVSSTKRYINAEL